MKRTAAFLLSVFLLLGCERGRTARAGYDPGLERDRYEDRIRARLNEFEHRFEGLEARMKGLDQTTQEHLRVDIAELRDRKDAIEDKFADLRKVSDSSWADIRASLDRDLDQLEMAYNLVAASNHGLDHAPINQMPR